MGSARNNHQHHQELQGKKEGSATGSARNCHQDHHELRLKSWVVVRMDVLITYDE